MFKALFPGTFDPPTLGHIEIIKRAAKLFDKLIIGIGTNYGKTTQLLSLDEKMTVLKDETKDLDNVEVLSFSGLVVDFAKELKVSSMIRSLRTENDFEYEIQMAIANRKLGDIETLFLLAENASAHISSTLIRELAYHKADLKDFIPKKLGTILQQHIQKEK